MRRLFFGLLIALGMSACVTVKVPPGQAKKTATPAKAAPGQVKKTTGSQSAAPYAPGQQKKAAPAAKKKN